MSTSITKQVVVASTSSATSRGNHASSNPTVSTCESSWNGRVFRSGRGGGVFLASLLAIFFFFISANAWATVYEININNTGVNNTSIPLLANDIVIITVGSGTGTYTGVISGGNVNSCTIYKKGAGKVIITKNQTAAAALIIEAGTVQMGDGTNTAAFTNITSYNLTSATATLRFEPGTIQTIDKIVEGAGKVEYKGAWAKRLCVAAEWKHTGTTTIEVGSDNGTDLHIGSIDGTGTAAANGKITNSEIIINGHALVFAKSNDYTHSAKISGNGLVYKGYTNSKVTLTGDNTYIGGTHVNMGTLQVGGGSNGKLPDNKPVWVYLNGTLSFYPPAAGMTFAGEILPGSDGCGKMRVTSTGLNWRTLTLTGNSSNFTGTITLENTNSLVIGNGSTTGAINGDISLQSTIVGGTAGTVTFNRSDECTYSKKISGNGKVVKKGSGTLIFTGANIYSNGTTISAGILQIGNNGTTGSISNDGEVKIEANAQLRFFRNDSYTYNGIISGTGNVVQYGTIPASVVTLGGANTYEGKTIIYAPLTLSSAGSIEKSAEVVLMSEDQCKFTISGNKKIKALSSSSNGVGVVDLGSSGTLTIGTDGGNDGYGNFYAKFSGTNGNVIKLGTGTFRMFGNDNAAGGTFTHKQGMVEFSGKWAGNYTKENGTSLVVSGNPTIGKALTLKGGDIYMDVTAGDKLSVTGAVSASDNNTLNLNTGAVTDYVLIQAASGIPNTEPYTVNSTYYTHLEAATNTKLKITASAQPLVPEITTTALPSGVKDTPYNETLTATGMAPLTWTLVGGSLPLGLTFSSGVISGTPTKVETSTITVKVSNSLGDAVKSFEIVINATAVAPIITTTTLPDAVKGVVYSADLAATGSSPFTWSIESGALPAGLTLNPTTGVISGTPTAIEIATFTVKVLNSAGNNTKELSITVIDPTAPPTIITTSLSDGTIGTAYSAQLSAIGAAPIEWTIDAGALPDGLNLSLDGEISGEPTTAETATFTVKASNGAGYDTKEFTITIGGVSVGEMGMEGIMVYPNPANEQLTINNEQLIINNVEIYDMMGRFVQTSEVGQSKTTINISHLPTGIYFLRITTETGVTVRKVVKE